MLLSWYISSGVVILFRIKYLTPCGLKILFFTPSVFIFFIGGTCAMEKNGDGISVHFSV
jgi:hypothetical protein